MALRTILTVGDETLKKKCRPVTEFNDHLHTLLDDMTETLLESGGVGLAAPQIGILRRVSYCSMSTRTRKRSSNSLTLRSLR